jgi:hypothetical protein
MGVPFPTCHQVQVVFLRCDVEVDGQNNLNFAHGIVVATQGQSIVSICIAMTRIRCEPRGQEPVPLVSYGEAKGRV